MEGKELNTSMKLPPPAVLGKLGTTKIQELSGGWVPLSSLWDDRPAAIVWLRHYGCIFCREQAAELRTISAEAEKLGNLAIVSTGSVDHGRDFAQDQGKGLRSLVDSQRSTYKVLSFKRGGMSSLDPRVYLRGIQAATKGFMQGRTRGDAMQQGGVLVVAAGGQPVFFQRSEFAGDHARLEAILGALREAAEMSDLPLPARAGVRG
jgi:hypothetical protein